MAKTQTQILAEWQLCMCGIAQCNWQCDWNVIQDVIDYLGANPGTGTVISVALSDSSSTPIYTISGSPITSTGTLVFTLAKQAANTIFAGPTTGANAQPTFRSLVIADIPTITAAKGGTGQDTSASTGIPQVSSGTWSVSPALANGTTGTTQSAGDNSTKIATTAYVDAAQALDLKIANNLSDVNNVTTSRNNLGFWTLWMTNGDQSTTSNSAGNITDLVFAASANTKYSFVGLFKTTGTGSSGVKFAVTIPTGATMFFSVTGATTASNIYGSANMSTSGTLTTTAFVNQTATLGVWIEGTVFISSTSGNIQFQFASGVNLSNSTISQLGTFIKISTLI